MRIRNAPRRLFTTRFELERSVIATRRARKAIGAERKTTRRHRSRTGRARDLELRLLEAELARHERGARRALRSLR